MKSLENAENLFGHLNGSIVKRIKNYINNPNTDTWDDIFSLIINKNFTTIWEAVLDINPSFCKEGREYDSNDNIVSDWEEIPSHMEVLRAIREATN